MIANRSYSEVRIPLWREKINLIDPVFSIGSCFSSMISEYMSINKMDIISNPFGSLYDPVSIKKNIVAATHLEPPLSSRFARISDIVLHFDYHSTLSALDEQQLTAHIKDKQIATKKQLEKAKWIIITLGSAIVFQLNADGNVVANCHKQDSKLFTKRILTSEEIQLALEAMVDHIHSFNPTARFIFTVSPVRHARHGLVENMYSKSLLRIAIQDLKNKYPEVEYFPSFEIMLDELRDYVYYKKDGIHPSRDAEDYIWQQFIINFDDESRKCIQQWAKIRQALSHKPLQPASRQYHDFLTKTMEDLKNLSSTIDVAEEIESLKAKLHGK